MRKRFDGVRRSPRTQILAGTAVMVGGAWLIAVWTVGLVLIIGGLLFCFDALFRDAAADRDEFDSSPIDRWRQMQ
jgi:hypothetical protein